MPPAHRGDRALPVLAGVLLALAFPPAAFLLPAFVGLAPLLLFIASRPGGGSGRWAATIGALVTGAVFYGARLTWILVALVDRPLAAAAAYVSTVLVLTGLLGVFGWAVHLVRDRIALPLPVVAAVLWTALEWLHAHLGPLSFPWLALGTSLAPFPRVAGAADLVGVSGLGFWLAAVNGAVAELLLRARGEGEVRGTGREGAPPRRRPGRVGPVPAAVATAALAVLPIAYGFIRAETLEVRPVASVAVVQPNIGVELKRDPRIALDTSLAALTGLTSRIGVAPDLIVWPEVALPVDLAATPWVIDSVRALSRGAGAPIVVGAYAGRGSRSLENDAGPYNSAFLVGADGIDGARYDKRALVPFVERVPFGLPRSVEAPYYGGLEPGLTGPVFTTAAGGPGGVDGAMAAAGRDEGARPREAGLRFGVLICYESAFPALAREYRRAGADFLVSITNDGWYGRPAWYGRTTALWQHPAHLVIRAIETRTGVVRSANTGFSLVIDPLGRVQERTALFEPAVFAGAVATTPGLTVAVRTGDWVGAGCAAAAIVLLGLGLLGILPSAGDSRAFHAAGLHFDLLSPRTKTGGRGVSRFASSAAARRGSARSPRSSGPRAPG